MNQDVTAYSYSLSPYLVAQHAEPILWQLSGQACVRVWCTSSREGEDADDGRSGAGEPGALSLGVLEIALFGRAVDLPAVKGGLMMQYYTYIVAHNNVSTIISGGRSITPLSQSSVLSPTGGQSPHHHLSRHPAQRSLLCPSPAQCCPRSRERPASVIATTNSPGAQQVASKMEVLWYLHSRTAHPASHTRSRSDTRTGTASYHSLPTSSAIPCIVGMP